MRAGLLRHRVTIQTAVETVPDGGTGQPVKSWEDDFTVYCSIEPLTGKELLTAAQVAARVSHKVIMRGRELPPTARLVFKGRVFHVESSLNQFERGIMRTLFATEVPA